LRGPWSESGDHQYWLLDRAGRGLVVVGVVTFDPGRRQAAGPTLSDGVARRGTLAVRKG